MAYIATCVDKFTTGATESTFFRTDSGSPETGLTSAVVSTELNTAGSFVFNVPPSNSFYGKFHKRKTYIDVYDDDDFIFGGRVSSIETDLSLEQQITCEGYLALLNDSMLPPVNYGSGDNGLNYTRYEQIVKHILQQHNAVVNADQYIRLGTIQIPEEQQTAVGHDRLAEFTSYSSALERLNSVLELLDRCYVFVRKNLSNGYLYLDTYYIDNLPLESETLEFGKNILDFSYLENTEEMATRLIAVGPGDSESDRVTLNSATGGVNYVEDATAVANYGIIYAYEEFPEEWAATPAILKKYAEKVLKEICVPQLTLNVNAIDLKKIQYGTTSYKVGVRAKANFSNTSLPIDSTRQLICSSQENDLLDPASGNLGFVTVDRPRRFSNLLGGGGGGGSSSGDSSSSGSGDKISISSVVGLRAELDDFNDHIRNQVIHVTADNKTTWNNKVAIYRNASGALVFTTS